MLDNCIESPLFELEETPDSDSCRLNLRFTAVDEMAQVDIISDGQSVKSFQNVYGEFEFTGNLPRGRYYRVRGAGKPKPRRYTEGEFQPMFLLNPIFTGE